MLLTTCVPGERERLAGRLGENEIQIDRKVNRGIKKLYRVKQGSENEKEVAPDGSLNQDRNICWHPETYTFSTRNGEHTTVERYYDQVYGIRLQYPKVRRSWRNLIHSFFYLLFTDNV